MTCIPRQYAEMIKDLRDFIAGTGPIPGWMGESLSAAEKFVKDYSDKLKAGLIPEGKKTDAAVAAFEKMYRELADKSQFWADKATNGSLPKKYAQDVAGEYASKADSLLNNKISSEARLAELTRNVNEKINKLAPGLTSRMGTAADAVEIVQSLAKGDTAAALSSMAKMLIAEQLGSITAAAAAAGLGLSLSVGAAALVGAAAALFISIAGKEFGIWDAIGKQLAPIGDWLKDLINEELAKAICPIPKSTNDGMRDAVTFAPRDPLALDLDNDGIETLAINPAAPILFDHNGDGAPSATGWLKGDDGWLVRDLDGDGKITSGKELLGVDTDITVGGVTRKAASGFEALRALDTHQDGDGKNLFDSRDAAFSQLRVWQDKNQNGVTDTGELSTLAALGIVSIQLQESATNVDLGGGNGITGKAKVTRRIGASTSTSELDSVLVTNDAAANLNLADNPFYTDLPDVQINATAQALPDMQGSGLVHSLREAMSLGTAGSSTLTATVQAFAAANTRDAQMALLDKLITEWGATSTLTTSGLPATGGWTANATAPNPALSADTQQRIKTFAQSNPEMYRKVIVLEQFNGQMGLAPLMNRWNVTLPTSVTNSLNAAYTALRESVYGALVSQTRLKPYLDAIHLTIDEQGLRFDTSALLAKITATMQVEAGRGIADLIDLIRFDQSVLGITGFDSTAKLRELIANLPASTPALNQLQNMGLLRSGSTTGTDWNDVYLGDDNANSFNAGAGNDVLDGGKGNDVLSGGADADIYIFGKDSGQDTINNGDGDAVGTNADTIMLVGSLTSSDVTVARDQSINDLVIRINGTNDKLTVKGYFTAEGSTSQVVEHLQFSDGSEWDIAAVKTAVIQGTDVGEALHGFSTAEYIDGKTGNDTIYGASGNDTLDGGEGNDSVEGDIGNDRLLGSSGDDVITDYEGNDTLDGGSGNDLLTGGNGADVYLFGMGSGKDTINNSDQDGAGNEGDAIQLGEGIGPRDLMLSRVSSVSGFSSDLLDLLVRIKGSSDTLRVESFFDAPIYTNDLNPNNLLKVRFANGDIWDSAKIKSKTLEGEDGSDWLIGYSSSDIIVGNSGSDQLHGEGGNDTLQGNDGDDQLSGAAGQDWLYGGAGNDALGGGAGSDTLVFSAGHGNDTVFTASSTLDLAAAQAAADTLVFDTTVSEDEYLFTSLTQKYVNTYHETIPTDLKIKSMASGEEIIILEQFNPNGLNIGAIKEIIFERTSKILTPEEIRLKSLLGSHRNDSINGFSSSESLQGLAGEDLIYGNNGDDTLDGGIDSDSIYGGKGKDVLRGDYGNDTLYGDDDDDHVFGGNGRDDLWGDAGNDTLDGGAGNDRLIGGDGVDTYLFAKGDGDDRVESDDKDVDLIVLDPGVKLSNLTFTRISPDSFKQGKDGLRIYITESRDLIYIPRYFADTSASYARDQIIVEGKVVPYEHILAESSKQLTLLENSREYFSTSYGSNASGVYELNHKTYMFVGGNGNETIHGGSEFNRIDAGAGNDFLDGGVGNDFLDGNSGNDTLYGGPGRDEMAGGTGINTYLLDGESENDVIHILDNSGASPTSADGSILKIGAPSSEIRIFRTRNDELAIRNNRTGAIALITDFFLGVKQFRDLQVSVIFNDQVVWSKEDLLTQAIKGSIENDFLVGYGSNDTLNGDAGSDTLRGNEGADQLNGGAEADVLAGDAGDDRLNGGQGQDSLQGGLGDDELIGGSGIDTMIGGAGNDLYVVDVAQDQIIELADGGFDSVNVWSNYVVSDHIEYAGLQGAANLTLTGNNQGMTLDGNEGNNLIRGGDGADTLDGFGGQDTLSGGKGNDLYYVDNLTTRIEEAAGAGTDSLWSYVDNIALSDNVENLYMAGRTVISGAGNGGDNRIFGNGLNNVIRGEAGNDRLLAQSGDDTLYGGAGIDNLFGGEGNDVYVLNRGDGDDIIYAYDTVGADTLQINGASKNDIWLTQAGADLEIYVLGQDRSATIGQWFGGKDYQLDQIRIGDSGPSLRTDRLQGLIQAMASMPPPGSMSSLPPADLARIQGAINTAWA